MKKYAFLFPNKNIKYAEFLKIVGDIVKMRPVTWGKDCVDAGIDAITRINDHEVRKKMIDVSLSIDRKFSTAGSNHNNLEKKLPIMMSSANLLANHYGLVQKLNTEELFILSFFSFVISPEEIGKRIKPFADHDLLNSLLEKTSDLEEQMDILGVIEKDYLTSTINYEDNDKLDAFKRKNIAMIKSSSREELLSMVPPISELCKGL